MKHGPGFICVFAVLTCLWACPQAPVTNPYDPAMPPALQVKASLAGTVRDQNTTQALVGATVILQSASFTASYSTASDGNYSFSTLTPGTYTLVTSHPSHFPTTQQVTFTAGAAQHTDVALIAIPATATSSSAHITGVVQKQGQLVLPLAQQDHSGILVELAGAGLRTVTNTGGVFDLFVNPGTFTLQLSAPNYDAQTIANVTAAANNITQVSTANQAIVLAPNPGQVAGVVTLEGNVTGQWAGTSVSLYGSSNGFTAADGSFLLSGVASGTYSLTLAHTGYDSQTLVGVQVTGGQVTSLPSTTLALSRGAIGGTIALADGGDPSGAVITLTGTAFTAVPSSAGAFLVGGIPVGSYTLTVRQTGYVEAALYSVTVTADATNAVGTITLQPSLGAFTINGGTPFTNNSNVTLALSAQNATQMRISEDANFATPALGDTNYRAFAATPSVVLSTGDGVKTLYAQYVDTYGFASAVFSSTIGLDTTPPVVVSPGTPMVTINSGGNTTNTPGGVVTLSMAVTDAFSGVKDMQVDNQSPPATPFQTYVAKLVYTVQNPGVDGRKTVYASFRDNAGNVAYAPAAAITLDTQAPAISTFNATCGGVQGATLCNASAVVLNIASSSNDVAQMALSNNVAFPVVNNQPFTSPITWLLSPGDGTQQVALKLTDNAGNTTAADVLTLTIDTQPPTSPSVLLASGAAYTNSTTVGLALSAVGASTVNISNCQDFNTAAPCTNTTGWIALGSAPSTWSLLAGADGPRTVYAQFRDAALNTTSVVTDSITLKTSAPTSPSITVAANNQNFVNSVSTLVLPSASGASEMLVACDGVLAHSAWVTYATAMTCLLPSPDGAKTIAAQFADNANNVASASSAVVYLDTTPPTPPAIGSASVITANTSFSMSLATNASDAVISGDPGGTRYVYQLKGGQYADWYDCGTALPLLNWPQDAACVSPPASFAWTLVPNSQNRLNVRARDRAGNTSSSDTLVVTHDSTAPGVVRHQNYAGTYSSFNSNDITAGNGYIVVTWEPPTDTDVAGYLLYYGPQSSGSPSAFNGTAANEGPSPINVGRPCASSPNHNDCSFRLTGLPNGTTVYLSVAAYDQTQIPGPNVGSLAGSLSAMPAPIVARRVGNVPVTSVSSNSSAWVRGLAQRDGLVYVSTGSPGNLAIVDAGNPLSPNVLAIETAHPLTAGYDVYVRDHIAYVADGTSGLRAFDISVPTSPTLSSTTAITAGQTATAITGQGEYLFLTTTNTTNGQGALYVYYVGSGRCSNTSSPTAPCNLSQYTPGYAPYVSVAAQGNYVYVSHGNAAAVVDVSNPNTPGSSTACSGGGSGVAVSGPYMYTGSSTNVVMCSSYGGTVYDTSTSSNRDSRKLAAYGGYLFSLNSSGLDIFTAAADAGDINLVFTASGMNYSYDSGTYGPISGDLEAAGNYLYVAGGPTGLDLYRLTGMRDLTVAASTPGTYQRSNPMVLGNQLMYGDNASLCYSNIDPAGLYSSCTSVTSGVVYNIVHEGDLTVVADYTSGTIAGQRMFADNLHAPSPTYSAYTPASYVSYGLAVRWPYAYVAGFSGSTSVIRSNSFRTVDLRTFTETAELTYTPSSTSMWVYNSASVALFGHYAYITNGSGTDGAGTSNLYVVDITNPASPTLAASLSFPGIALGNIAQSGSLLYINTATIGAGTNGFHVLSINPTTPTSLTDVANWSQGTVSISAIAVSGQYLYVVGTGNVAVFDVSNLANIQLVGSYNQSVIGTGVAVGANYVYVTNAQSPQQMLLEQ